MTYDFVILDKLQQAVKQALAQSPTPTFPVAFVRVNFDKPDDGKFLELVHIPSNRQGDFWGEEKNYQGSLRLIFHWPKDGTGFQGPSAVIAPIIGYFTKGLVIDDVKITEKPNYTGDIDATNEILYPYTLRYTCYRP